MIAVSGSGRYGILNVFDTIFNYLSEDKTNCVGMVYLDYTKAFNEVDHGILLHKI